MDAQVPGNDGPPLPWSQQPFQMLESDQELLRLRRDQLRVPSAFRIAEQTQHEFVRYADRYEEPPEPFHKSKLLTLQSGIHFCPELLPSSARGGQKKRPAASVSSSGDAKRRRKAPSSQTPSGLLSSQRQMSRLRRADGSMAAGRTINEDLDADVLDAAGSDDDDEEDAAGEKRRGDDEDDEAPVTEEEYSDDEEDLLDDGGADYDGFEDGGDDPLEDGDDDEPVY